MSLPNSEEEEVDEELHPTASTKISVLAEENVDVETSLSDVPNSEEEYSSSENIENSVDKEEEVSSSETELLSSLSTKEDSPLVEEDSPLVDEDSSPEDSLSTASEDSPSTSPEDSPPAPVEKVADSLSEYREKMLEKHAVKEKEKEKKEEEKKDREEAAVQERNAVEHGIDEDDNDDNVENNDANTVEKDSGDAVHASNEEKTNSATKQEVLEKFNFASFDAGAKMLRVSDGIEASDVILKNDNDKYMMTPCDEKAWWFVVQLSEDIVVTSVSLSNYEHYASSVKRFQVLGSSQYPTDGWILLGQFIATQERGVQEFVMKKGIWARYLKLRILSHHGEEFYCTLTSFKAHGSTAVEGLRDEMTKMSEEMADFQKLLEEGDEIDVAGDSEESEIVDNDEESDQAEEEEEEEEEEMEGIMSDEVDGDADDSVNGEEDTPSDHVIDGDEKVTDNADVKDESDEKENSDQRSKVNESDEADETEKIVTKEEILENEEKQEALAVKDNFSEDIDEIESSGKNSMESNSNDTPSIAEDENEASAIVEEKNEASEELKVSPTMKNIEVIDDVQASQNVDKKSTSPEKKQSLESSIKAPLKNNELETNDIDKTPPSKDEKNINRNVEGEGNKSSQDDSEYEDELVCDEAAKKDSDVVEKKENKIKEDGKIHSDMNEVVTEVDSGMDVVTGDTGVEKGEGNVENNGEIDEMEDTSKSKGKVIEVKKGEEGSDAVAKATAALMDKLSTTGLIAPQADEKKGTLAKVIDSISEVIGTPDGKDVQKKKVDDNASLSSDQDDSDESDLLKSEAEKKGKTDAVVNKGNAEDASQNVNEDAEKVDEKVDEASEEDQGTGEDVKPLKEEEKKGKNIMKGEKDNVRKTSKIDKDEIKEDGKMVQKEVDVKKKEVVKVAKKKEGIKKKEDGKIVKKKEEGKALKKKEDGKKKSATVQKIAQTRMKPPAEPIVNVFATISSQLKQLKMNQTVLELFVTEMNNKLLTGLTTVKDAAKAATAAAEESNAAAAHVLAGKELHRQVIDSIAEHELLFKNLNSTTIASLIELRASIAESSAAAVAGAGEAIHAVGLQSAEEKTALQYQIWFQQLYLVLLGAWIVLMCIRSLSMALFVIAVLVVAPDEIRIAVLVFCMIYYRGKETNENGKSSSKARREMREEYSEDEADLSFSSSPERMSEQKRMENSSHHDRSCCNSICRWCLSSSQEKLTKERRAKYRRGLKRRLRRKRDKLLMRSVRGHSLHNRLYSDHNRFREDDFIDRSSPWSLPDRRAMSVGHNRYSDNEDFVRRRFEADQKESTPQTEVSFTPTAFTEKVPLGRTTRTLKPLNNQSSEPKDATSL
eukprot:g2738.t1